MVAEEVPPVTASIHAGHTPARRHRVGVKRSSEQTNRLVGCMVPKRPTLDAYPAKPVRTLIVDNEERRTNPEPNNSSGTARSTARPLSSQQQPSLASRLPSTLTQSN